MTTKTDYDYGGAAHLEIKIREIIDSMTPEKLTEMMMRGGLFYVTGSGPTTDVGFVPGNPDDLRRHPSFYFLPTASLEPTDGSSLEFDEEAEEYIPMADDECREFFDQMGVAAGIAETLETSIEIASQDHEEE